MTRRFAFHFQISCCTRDGQPPLRNFSPTQLCSIGPVELNLMAFGGKGWTF